MILCIEKMLPRIRTYGQRELRQSRNFCLQKTFIFLMSKVIICWCFHLKDQLQWKKVALLSWILKSDILTRDIQSDPAVVHRCHSQPTKPTLEFFTKTVSQEFKNKTVCTTQSMFWLLNQVNITNMVHIQTLACVLKIYKEKQVPLCELRPSL